MDQLTIFSMIEKEIKRAKKLFPSWPRDMVHGAAIVQEESGELVRAVLNLAYKPPREVLDQHEAVLEVVTEAIQTAAMAIRFLQHFEDMQARPAEMLTEEPKEIDFSLTSKTN